MDEIEMVQKVTEVEARAKSNSRRIEELKPVVDEIHTIGKTLVVLCKEMETTNKSIKALTVDVEELKSADGKRYRGVRGMIAGALIGAIAGALITSLTTLF